MNVFRICLVNGDRRLKADLKALDEQSVRTSLRRWFDSSQWQVLEIKCIKN